MRDPETGYYDPLGPYATVPRSSVLPIYANHAQPALSLQGMRLGIIRESMLVLEDLPAATRVAAASAVAASAAKMVTASAMPRLTERPRQPEVASPRTGHAASSITVPCSAGCARNFGSSPSICATTGTVRTPKR